MAGWADVISIYEGTGTSKFRCLLYGPPGSGKTTLAGTFPNSFFIDTDRGMRSLIGKHPFIRLPEARVPDPVGGPFARLMTVLFDARQKTGPFAAGGPLASVETLVLDSMTALADDFLLPEAMLEAGRNLLRDKATFDDYGKLKQRLIAVSNVLKDISDKFNVVVTALVDEEKNELTGELIGIPLMTGKYRTKIGADFDEEYFMQASPGKDGPVYTLYARPHRWYEAKTRLTNLVRLPDPTYDKIMQNLKFKA